MSLPNWPDLFDVIDRRPPFLPRFADAFAASVTSPLRPDEVAELTARDAPDPAAWRFPTGLLPASYLAFLGWSNGGHFVVGEREYAVLAAEEVRQYMLDYALPYHLPGTVPVALDGRGGFLLLDLRAPPDATGEYPVLHSRGDDLGFDAATTLADSFPALLRDRTPIG